MRIIPFLFCLFIISFRLQAQKDIISYHYDPSWQAANKNIDIFHYQAKLKITPKTNFVEAIVTYDFRPYQLDVDSISFLTYSMNMQSVKIDKKKVDYWKQGNYTVIEDLPSFKKDQAYQITFTYSVQPKVQLYNAGWNDPLNLKRKQIWSHRPHQWLPFYPDRLTADMIVTVDSNFKVYSNGIRESIKDNKDGSFSWHYAMKTEHPFFSTCLVIGNYKYKSFKTNNGLALEYWYYPNQEDHFEPTYRYSVQMFDILENEFGFKYPYELYRQIPLIDYLYGAMETTTATVYGDYMHVNDRGYLGRRYVNVNAHELVHQWFGNYLSHLRNKDVWLTESFATYYAKICEKEIFGDDYYQFERNKEFIRTFNAARKNDFGVGHGQAGSDRWYPKGSLVLDMMRDVIGEEAFKKSIQHYLEVNASEVVETNDFLQAIREASGYSLEWFFDQWILKGSEPHYKVSYTEIEKNEKSFTQISVEQIHKTDRVIALFKMPIEFEVHYTDGSNDSKTAWIEKKFHHVLIENTEEKKIAFVLFDPNRKIIKKLSFDRNKQELFAQALFAENMIDRYDALLEMKSVSWDEKFETLEKVYENETFHLTKAEALRQMLEIKNEEHVKSAIQHPNRLGRKVTVYELIFEDLIAEGIKDKDYIVRRVVLEEVKNIPINLEEEYRKLLFDSSYINVELALENLVHSFPDKAETYFELTKDEQGWRGRNIHIKWLELRIQRGDKSYLNQLLTFTDIRSYEFETVQNSIESLSRLNYLDDTLIQNLFEAYLYWNFKVAKTADIALRNYLKMTDSKQQILKYAENNEWENWEMKKIKRIIN